MSPEASQEYQCAVEEAANAFMKVMSLRGFQVRDYPQNFVAQMAQTTRLAFEASRQGAHSRADALVSGHAQRSGHPEPALGQNAPQKVCFPLTAQSLGLTAATGAGRDPVWARVPGLVCHFWQWQFKMRQ